MTYYQKLKDPRWQKKRLEILNRDDFTCQLCSDKESTLVVHHLKYSGEPWEIGNESLITYCQECHENEHEAFRSSKEWLYEYLKKIDQKDIMGLAELLNYLSECSEYKLNIVFEAFFNSDFNQLASDYCDKYIDVKKIGTGVQ